MLSEAINRFLGRYTYRQRLVFFGLVFFSFVPPSTYFITNVLNFHLKNAERLSYHDEIQEVIGSLVNDSLQYELLTLLDSEKNRDDLASLDRHIDEQFTILNSLVLKAPQYHVPSIGDGFGELPPVILDPKEWELLWDQFTKKASYSTHEELVAAINKVNVTAMKYVELSNLMLNFYGSNLKGVAPMAEIALKAFPRAQFAIVDAALDPEKSKDKLREKFDTILTPLNTKYDEKLSAFDKREEYYIQLKKTGFQNILDQYIKDMENGIVSYEKAIEAIQNSFRVRETILDLIHKTLSVQIKQLWWMIYILATSLICGTSMVFLYVVKKLLTKHLNRLTHYLRELAKGNFGPCFCAGDTDEFGQMGKAFDEMVASIETIAAEFHELSHKLGQGTIKLTENTREQSLYIRQQEEEVAAIKTIAQSSSDAHHALMEKTREFWQGMAQIGAIEETRRGLALLQNNMAEFLQSSGKIVESLQNVEQKVASMHTWVVFMNKVSESANMLSLNAAIETANITKDKERFQAISLKIQRFAGITYGTAQDIKNVLVEMTKNVSVVKDEAKECLEEISNGARQLVNVSNQLNRLTLQSREQISKVEGFARMVEEQLHSVDEMLHTIGKLNEAANSNTSVIQELGGELTNLGGTAGSLQSALERFKKLHFEKQEQHGSP